MNFRLVPLALTFFLSPLPSAAGAQELRILEDQSVFAIVTHKGGFASGLAHNHLVAASAYKARLVSTQDAPAETTFEIELAAKDLVVDDGAIQKTWYPRIELLKIVDEPFADVPAKDRAKIREAMLGKKQLDIAAHPTMRARLEGLVAATSKVGGKEMAWKGELAFEVHGKTVKKTVTATLVWEEGDETVLHIEAVGTFLFSDFGIKPFSAMMGAVKNLDEIHVYASIRAAVIPLDADPAL